MNGCSKKLCPMQVGAVDNCSLTKEQCPYFTQDVDYQKVLDQIKAVVAREIFEEIEDLLREWFDFFRQDNCIREYCAIMAALSQVSELKKKYLE